jgi:hypothetical protein
VEQVAKVDVTNKEAKADAEVLMEQGSRYIAETYKNKV